MTTMTFDTYAFIKRLTEAGVTEPQAEAFSAAFKDVQQANLKELATKEDLMAVKNDLKDEIKELRHEMKELELRLIIKLGSLMALSVGVIVALVKLL